MIMKNVKLRRGITRCVVSVGFVGFVASILMQTTIYLFWIPDTFKTPTSFRTSHLPNNTTFNTVFTKTIHIQEANPLFVQAMGMRVYMFSAFIYENMSETNDIFNGFVKVHGFFDMRPFLKEALHSSMHLQNISRPNEIIEKHVDSKTTVKLVINSWDYLNIDQENNTIPINVEFACCVLLINKSILRIPSNNIRASWYRFQKEHLEPLQHVCSFEGSLGAIEAVSLVEKGGQCPTGGKYYIRPVKVENQKKPGIIVCAKVLYGELNGARLVEWFEAVRLLGARKVLLYTYKLNESAWRVIHHFESIGLAQHSPFDFPEKDTIPREFEDESLASVQMWKDEVITVVDCQQRMAGYQYAVFLDVDEFLLPANMPLRHIWLQYFNKKFHQDKRLAGLMFLTHMHVTSWGPTNPKGELFIERYSNGTTGLYDRMKFVFKPDRVMEGMCTAHSFTAKPGFKTYLQSTANMSEIGVHHFRSCRNEWNKLTKLLNWWKDDYFDGDDSTMCFNYNRRYLPVVPTLADMIRADVKKVQALLNVYYSNREKKNNS